MIKQAIKAFCSEAGKVLLLFLVLYTIFKIFVAYLDNKFKEIDSKNSKVEAPAKLVKEEGVRIPEIRPDTSGESETSKSEEELKRRLEEIKKEQEQKEREEILRGKTQDGVGGLR